MNKQNNQKPITAWAVEVNGKIHPYDVVGTRSFARIIRNEEAQWNPKSKPHVRKVTIQVVPGAR